MGVVHSGSLSDVDIEIAIEQGEIVIWPFNADNLTPVGYNLSFTKFIFSVKNNLLLKIEKDQTNNEIFCWVEANDTLLILTQEAVWISNKYNGTFHSKVGIVSKGFGHISTTLDPHWEGPLLISLNNPTNKRIKLVIADDKTVGIKYRTFVTLMLTETITPAKKAHDNPPSRVDILRDTTQIKNKTEEFQKLVTVIDKIRNFERLQVNIGKAVGGERTEKIKEFKHKYERFTIDVDSSIEEALEINNSILNKNKIKYYGIVTILSIATLIIIGVGLYALIKDKQNLLSYLAIISSILIPGGIAIYPEIKSKYLS